MKRVPREIILQMLDILFVDAEHNITDSSSRLALEFAKAQEPPYRKTLYMGLFREIRAYKKVQKMKNKQKQLIGEEDEKK